ncbi:hypothetical protein ACM55I_09590 [Flavobacterium sp. GB2R13]|uniref:hypothetical protein n=1 Tax=Flavobacterium algoris TaxID=3398733 RepID=UPI003A8B37C5
MKNNLLLLLVLLFTTVFYAQTNGIAYQAVLYKPEGKTLPGVAASTSPMINTAICLRFTFFDGANSLEYQETISTKTDEFGIVNTSIGTGTQSAGYVVSFKDIKWNVNDKTLKVELDEKGTCSSFIEISNQPFSSSPFAFNAITANNVSGIVALDNGGTGANNVDDALINLGAEDILNKSVDIGLDADSNQKYPSVKSVKTYVDGLIATTLKENVIDYIATDGQVQFKTVIPIASGKNVNVYRNGIRISIIIVDPNTIRLEAGVICYANDEIKIVQFY